MCVLVCVLRPPELAKRCQNQLALNQNFNATV